MAWYSSTETSGLATSALQTDTNTALEIMDDWDESDRAKIVPSSGLSAYGADTTGANAYVTVVAAPARICHYVHVSVGNNGAIISCNGGTTEHFAIPANTERLFPGLIITSAANIQGKNLVTDNNYTNLRISVW